MGRRLRGHYYVRARLVSYSFLVFFGCLFYRMVTLQAVNNQSYQSKASQQHFSKVTIPPERGYIYDRNKNILSMSVLCDSAFGDPSLIKNVDEATDAVKETLGVDPAVVKKRLSKPLRFVWLKRKCSKAEAQRLRDRDIAGIGFRKEYKRVYPKGSLLAHVLGYVDIDNKGLDGIELQFNRLLSGKAGWRITEKDGFGREILPHRCQEVEPIDGYHIVLSIDEVIQSIVEKELEKTCLRWRPKNAGIVVVQPHTGEILAAAVYPSFDANNPGKVSLSRRKNILISNVYEPGSTFKIVSIAAALDKGVVHLNQVFDCESGRFAFGGRILHDVHPYDDLSVKEIVQKSSNIGAAKIAIDLGEASLYQALRDFGFGRKSGICLRGEVQGILHPVSRWNKLSITRLPMGHEIAVTPLQLALALCSIANGGYAVKPILVKEIEAAQGRVFRRFGQEERRRIISERTAKQMTEAMNAVVAVGGTGTRAAVEGYEVAGKTGTAQKVNPQGGYSHSKFIASFVGFLPADDPEVLILVFLDEPHPMYYGGVVAAPAFSRIALQIVRYMNFKVEIV